MSYPDTFVSCGASKYFMLTALLEYVRRKFRCYLENGEGMLPLFTRLSKSFGKGMIAKGMFYKARRQGTNFFHPKM